MQELIAYLQTLADVQFFGVTYGEYALALLVLITILLINGFMHGILVRVLDLILLKNKRSENEKWVDALSRPLKLVPWACGGFLILYILHLQGKPLSVASELVRSILIGVFFWSVIRVLNASGSFAQKLGFNVDATAQAWIEKSILVFIAIFGVVIILDVWGVPIAPIIGSLGVLGIGVGLAAKDLFSNLISGILIMGEKRFVPGEWIQVEGVVNGTVLKINFRSTLIQLFDSSPVYVPNSLLADGAVINYSRMINRRISWTIGLEYTTPPQVLAKIRDDVESWLLNNSEMCSPQEQALFVRIDSFGDNAINLMIYCFTKTVNWGDWLRIKGEFALALINIVQNAGSGFAFPSRTLYFGNNAPVGEGQSEVVNPLELLQQSAAKKQEQGAVFQSPASSHPIEDAPSG